MRFPLRSILAISLLGCGLVSQLFAERTGKGLQVIYDFNSYKGEIISDGSGISPAIDLRIADPKDVRRSKGALEIRNKTKISSEKPAKRLSEAIKRSGRCRPQFSGCKNRALRNESRAYPRLPLHRVP